MSKVYQYFHAEIDLWAFTVPCCLGKILNVLSSIFSLSNERFLYFFSEVGQITHNEYFLFFENLKQKISFDSVICCLTRASSFIFNFTNFIRHIYVLIQQFHAESLQDVKILHEIVIYYYCYNCCILTLSFLKEEGLMKGLIL